ncbi:imidazole glycerol phosphate synthase subunit HisH [Ancylomarina euxinus]|uniref:Imidazole glycerol phosphate synthase subunit HisH n=1 Tax=Ancylomarina euxinus TaxID=2283627 RepID=A0A425Y3U9_9BACT|nr:imidazole glycerol phosphate synthase subunit HisH [Ancylomarina euxinus]MCZ4694549.1 imidazole glycerol phosphate synthase subunit HisH [Ancylomarina euxinus]MUP14092.1 imidazole glycerol phosphate synthase subunit HisH [Ancylomarina euxinus]RRG22950.1 imidazole glycerol phosphate synthase subunit HisH [Ancylomarina euxinus]
MSKQNIVIIDYKAGNVQSVKYALERLGVYAKVSNCEETIRQADKVIFPGVGEAAWAMKKLKETGLDQLIPQLKQPVLGICLGMQLMCTSSEEGDTKGLGLFPVKTLKFPAEDKVPHMGWNQIRQQKAELFNGIKENSFVYFVHSYYVPLNEHTTSETHYIRSFSASLQKANFYACQFHPEKSGDIGQEILNNFIKL